MRPEVAGHVRPRTFAVVLNHRTPGATIAAVQSICASTSPPDATLVVDNASGDDSPARILAAVPDVELMASALNGGFSAGCNLGIRSALARGADRLLLINSDVVVSVDALARLSDLLDRDPSVGVAAPIVTRQSNPDAIESAGIRYSRSTGRMRHRYYDANRHQASLRGIADVDGASGCAMLVRREVFDAIGLFAPEYFYSFEDVDFCLRARQAGFKTVIVSEAVVRHAGGETIGRASARRTYFSTRNHLLLASRVGPQAWPVRVARAANIVGLNVAHAVFRSETPVGAGLAAVIRGVRDHLKGKYGTDEPPST
jgi:GT2 family glycosyltransferase